MFAALATTSIVVTGVFTKLLAGDPRVLVVTLHQDAGQSARELLKRECGSLPGISVVPDRGDPSPAVQGRFPVRFKIGGATPQQEAGLQSCIDGHRELVRGILNEGVR